ncbi:Uu.00g011090.m01.CDS01 [Anthostomella pinea]|uniref:Uu.00g011090.m01.CDS01 n=1 Tax=Anthostomella pinea TaxID=933095 RepID=A0AAI8VYL0_9PEZI|nr:Uu.00g011090.m01.CDS01 [Anthostomella pinea]
MSFCIAVQSAIFYLVSCSPCAQAQHHQRSKTKAKKEREEKARLQAEYPGSYQHPDPFNTNPYWAEEIMMGPHIKAKKYTGGAGAGGGSSKNTSERGLNSAGKDTISVAGSSVGVSGAPPETSPVAATEHGKMSFSTTMSTTVSDDWNRKLYQREDEELWGHELSHAGHKLMDAIKHAGTSAGRLLEASLKMDAKPITDQDREKFYFAPKNPPVNDYHPPIVRQRPTHADAHKWMLQPPPAAKVMEGKIPVSRSASFASHMSRRTTMSDGPTLGRLVHEKNMEAKLRSGELPSELESTEKASGKTPDYN